MDGNQRWAKENNLNQIDGYQKGLEKIKEIINFCLNANIKNLSIYALSAENFKRGSVSIIFNLIKERYVNFLKEINEDNKVKIDIVGEKKNLSNDLLNIFSNVKKVTKNNKQLNLNILFNYGLQDELIHIIKQIILKKKEVTYENIRSEMYLSEFSDPDILIRTGGYQRLSNFIPLNLSYTELFFTKSLWPNFSIEELNQIIKKYESIKRNYGL